MSLSLDQAHELMHAVTRREARQALRIAQLIACGTAGSDDWKRLQESAIERSTSGLVKA